MSTNDGGAKAPEATTPAPSAPAEMSTHAAHTWTKQAPGDTAHWLPQLLADLQPHAHHGESPTWTLRRLLADSAAVHAFLDDLGVPPAIEGVRYDTIQRVAYFVGQIHVALGSDVERPTGLQAKIRATLLRQWKEGRAQVERAHAEREAAQVYVQHGGDIVRMSRSSYRRWLHACAAGRFSGPEDAEGAVVVGKNILFYRVDFGREDFWRFIREQGLVGYTFHEVPPCCYEEPDGDKELFDIDSGIVLCEGCGGAIGVWTEGGHFHPFDDKDRARWQETHPMLRRHAPSRVKLTTAIPGSAPGEEDALWWYNAATYEAALQAGADPDRRVLVDKVAEGDGWFWFVWGVGEDVFAQSDVSHPVETREEAITHALRAARELYDVPEEG